MAVPTAPTESELIQEGLELAGWNSTRRTALSSRSDKWIREVMNDIWLLGKRMRTLQKVSVTIVDIGVSRYAVPTDYHSDLSLVLLDGDTTGTAQAGSSSDITLANDDSTTQADMEKALGILIYNGAGKGSFSEVTSFNTTSKVASVSPNFNTAPDDTSSYMIVTRTIPLNEGGIWELDGMERNSGSSAQPNDFFLTKGSTNAEIVLDPIPYRASAIPWGMQMRFYSNLLKLDTAIAPYTTILQEWRNLIVKGIYARALQNDRDSRAQAAITDYNQHLVILVQSELYRPDWVDMQMVA
jgi:hypothetical protein